jgi:DNA-binding winged helix-turn-helix (wHTH) protein
MTAVAFAKQEPLEQTSISDCLQADHPGVLSFSPFRLDLVEQRVWKGERQLRLRPKPFAILRFLALHPRRILMHSEIVEAVWGRIAMSDSLLRTHVHDLRSVLGEPIIETIVGRGYRFMPNVDDVSDDDASGPHATRVKVVSAHRLELLRSAGSSGAAETSEGTGASLTARHARILRQVAEVLTGANGDATVVVIVGDSYGARVL